MTTYMSSSYTEDMSFSECQRELLDPLCPLLGQVALTLIWMFVTELYLCFRNVCYVHTIKYIFRWTEFLYISNCPDLELLEAYVRELINIGMDDRGSRFQFPAGAGNFSLHYRVQNGSGAHLTSYPMGTRGTFLGVKRPGREADHSPPSSTEVREWVEVYLHFPNMTLWCGA
jgi:hypothetical protein